MKKKQNDLHRHGKKWSTKEIALLRKLYPDRFTHELVERMGRSAAAIITKAGLLGIRKNWITYDPDRLHKCKLWTQKEIDRLTKLYPITPVQQLIPHFPRRTKASITKKATLLGLKKKYLRPHPQPTISELNLWREQKKRLIDLYPTMSNKKLSKKFGRSEEAIHAAARRFGLHKAGYKPRQRNGDGRLWSQKEDAILKKLYPTAWTRDLAARLGRTKGSVFSRAGVLGLKKDPEKFTRPPHPNAWSHKDIKRLWQLWQEGHTITRIAEIIGKTHRSAAHQIARQKRDFGLPKRQEPGKPWSAKEDEYLIRYYNKKTYQKIADKLGRTRKAICMRVIVLKITQSNKWDPKDITRLRQLWKKGYTAAQIAEIIGKPQDSVSHQIARQKRDFGLPGRQEREKIR
jgi:hypothetical protein